MKLLDQIIDALSNESVPLVGALLKTKVLLHKIGKRELVEWVNNELNGYAPNSAVPSYRVLPAQVLANLHNGFHHAEGHPIPTSHLKESYRTSLEKIEMREGLGALESFLTAAGGTLQRPIPMEANGLLSKALTNDFQVQRAWSQIQISGIRQIATEVRSRLLDFVLDLNENLSGELTDAEAEKRVAATDAENIFNNAIFGNNTTVIIGNSNTQSVKVHVVKGDFSSLEKALHNHRVEEGEIEALRNAIAADAIDPNGPERSFGASVKSWLQSMMIKAINASWQIELGIAGNLLSSALQRYYGWL